MKFASIALAAAALLSLHTLSNAQTFEAVSGTGFTTQTTSLPNSYLAPLPPAGATVRATRC